MHNGRAQTPAAHPVYTTGLRTRQMESHLSTVEVLHGLLRQPCTCGLCMSLRRSEHLLADPFCWYHLMLPLANYERRFVKQSSCLSREAIRSLHHGQNSPLLAPLRRERHRRRFDCLIAQLANQLLPGIEIMVWHLGVCVVAFLCEESQ